MLRTLPDGIGGRPPILFIHENRGLSPYVIAVLAELAGEGFETHAPDLLHRITGRTVTPGEGAFSGDPATVTTRLVPEDVHESDLLEVFDHMTGTPVVVGLCFGAEMGWRVAVRRRPRAAALIYGVAPEDVTNLRCPVFAAYAQDDPRVNDGLDRLCRRLATMDVPYRIASYPGTLHAFHDRTRPERFHPAAAAALWTDLLDFLQSAGSSGPTGRA